MLRVIFRVRFKLSLRTRSKFGVRTRAQAMVRVEVRSIAKSMVMGKGRPNARFRVKFRVLFILHLGLACARVRFRVMFIVRVRAGFTSKPSVRARTSAVVKVRFMVRLWIGLQ